MVKVKVALIVLFFFSSCKSAFNVTNFSIFYSLDEIDSFVEAGHFETTEIREVPRKLIRTLQNEGIRLFIDSTNISNAYLWRYGVNKNGKKGYFLITLTNHPEAEFICILYYIEKDGLIVLSLYNLPRKITAWDDVKMFLIPDNGRMRFKGMIKN